MTKKAMLEHRSARGPKGPLPNYVHVLTENGKFLNQDGSEGTFAGTAMMWDGEKADAKAKAFAEKHGWTIVEPDAEAS